MLSLLIQMRNVIEGTLVSKVMENTTYRLKLARIADKEANKHHDSNMNHS